MLSKLTTGIALLKNSSRFSRFTPSTRAAVFYAACSAALRGSERIEPQDLLVGVAELPHKTDCGFRHLYAARAEIAAQVGIPSLPSDAKERFRTLKRRSQLSAASAIVLRAAAREADRDRQFWIDNDHLQAALALCNERHDAALRTAGYSIERTRKLGEEGRLRCPPRKPSLRERARRRSTLFWVFVGGVAGFVLVHLVNVLRAK
jgi:hypothetical protein